MKPLRFAAVLAIVLASALKAAAGNFVATETAHYYNLVATNTLTVGTRISLPGVGAAWEFRVWGGSATFNVAASTGTPPSNVYYSTMTAYDSIPIQGNFKFWAVNPALTLTGISAGATSVLLKLEGGTGTPLQP